ncbi:carboxyl-terminal processing protease CtpA [Phormidium sp. CCY1219]|uniref:carboxyl-terminal processing protease CtpA n=1 Tax=Phormidium sp. CCY1219 TaxID=2886104 RepID=UPI002D1F3DC3|nr:carboxyl-terminal processing protease CtpA [Phormidium sp. CCY1219]MEB3828177.1 PDZ domain-containing protein [Phormidium sp. CCY1219]
MAKRVFWVGLLFVVQLALGWCWWTPPVQALTQEQQLFSQAWRIVNYAYLDETFNHQNWWFVRQRALKKPLKNREETYEEIRNMLASLDDPFTRLLTPDRYRSLQVNTSGELTGVGVQIALDEQTDTIAVVAPIDGSPADAAGLQPRDRILEIDGLSTVGLSLDDAAARMRGEVGTSVTLKVQRYESEAIENINIKRERIALNPVVAQLQTTPDGVKVGYIRLSQFNANATAEIAQAVNDFEAQGADRYILDLRSNPGGLLQAGIEVARLWLNEGAIVYTVNRQGILGSFDATGEALTDDPLVVLVDRGTASASEILAGALQDNGRALLVGETTFGKGLIQSLFDLSDGSGLAVTVAKYETPNHRDINKNGIVPDKVVPLDSISRKELATIADRQYQAALELLSQPAVLADAG